MIHVDFQGKKLPRLGVGTMRLPVIDGAHDTIDVAQTEKMVDYAMEHGVNYFDTAWGYHDGSSEPVIGAALARYPRESFFLATKFPGYDLDNMGRAEEIFEEQLTRCGVEYFDFYLVHNVCELNIDAYLDEKKYGTVAYLLKQKESGHICHLGFSAHCSYDVLERFLEAYGDHMEFCQLQVNWLDWTFQEAREKCALMAEHGIPVWVMEPLRGGKLAELPAEDEAKLAALRPDEGVCAWAFRFLQSLDGVAVVLSGMSSLVQLEENIATFEDERPLDAHEQLTLQGIADAMASTVGLPCTGCRYCTDHCPQGLDIPLLIEAYNERCMTGEGDFISCMLLQTLPEGKHPGDCTGCGSCAAVCPQQLEIPEAMADFASRMGER